MLFVAGPGLAVHHLGCMATLNRCRSIWFRVSRTAVVLFVAGPGLEPGTSGL